MKNIKEGINLDDVKFLLSTVRSIISIFEKIIELLEVKIQECENLRVQLDMERIYYTCERNDRLAAEKFISELNNSYDKLQNSYIISSRNLNKYNKALEEIEQYFEHRCNICRDNYGLGADCSVCWHKDIRNIISKAKGEENAR